MARRHAPLSPVAADIELLEQKQLLSSSTLETAKIDALMSDTSSLAQLLSGSQPSAPAWDGSFDNLSETETVLEEISALATYGEQLTSALNQMSTENIAGQQALEEQLMETMRSLEHAIDATQSLEGAMRSSIHDLLTQETSSVDLTALSPSEGNRTARGTVPLSDPTKGDITIVVPRGKSSTASLQEEIRWTQPPTLVTNPDHGFAASQSTIPSSVINWRTKKIESFSMTSVDTNGKNIGGVVYNDGFSMPIVHDLATGRIRDLGGRIRGSADIVLSPDGSRAVTAISGAGSSNSMRIWDTATGRQIGPTQKPEYVTQMAFRPGNAPDLLYATEYGQFVSWNKVDGGGDRIFEEVWPRFAVSESIAAAPRIVNLGRGRFDPGDTVELYDFQQERRLPALATGNAVRDLAISPDGKTLLTWDRGGIVHIWDITSRQKITTITPTAGTRDARAQFGHNGSLIIITDNTGKLREFSVDSLRNGNTEPLVQRTYDTRDSILAHPGAPGYITSRTDRGSVSLRASGLPAIVTNGEQVPAVEGKGDGTVWLDYSTVHELVTQGQFRITGAPAGTQFTVTPFMGTRRLASQSANAGEVVFVSNAEGISAVAVQGVGWNGPIALAQMDVSTLASAAPADSKELGLLSNDLFAQTWADTDEVWDDKWLDYRSQMAAVEGDPKLPMLVRATGGTLYGFTYHTNVHYRSGFTKSLARSALPESAFIRIDTSTAILLPGYPAALYVNVGDGTIVGTRKGQNGGILLEKKQSANILDLVPKEGMDMRVDWLDTVSAGEGTREGFFREALTPGVVSHPSPESSAIVTTMRVKNSGSFGGAIRAEIYVSSDIHPERVLQKTIEGNISASDVLTLRFRADLPKRDRSSYAYVKIIGPDGTVIAEEGAGHVGRNPDRPSPKEITERDKEYEEAQQGAFVRTTQYWADLARSSPVYAGQAAAGLQETLSAMGKTMATVAARIAQERRTLGAMIEKRVLLAEASATLGYTGESPEGMTSLDTYLQFGDQLLEALREMIARYPEKWWNRNTATPTESDVFVRKDTSASALYHGLAQQLWSVKDQALRTVIMEKASVALGIPTSTLQSLNRTTTTAFASDLRSAFVAAGYGHLFSRTPVAPSQDSAVIAAGVTGNFFTTGSIPVQWDTANGSKRVTHTSVYLVDNMTTKRQASQTPLITVTGLATSAQIPVESIGMSGENLGFKIAVWFTDGTKVGGYIENPFVVGWNGNWSPDTPISEAELQAYVDEWDILSDQQKNHIREAMTFDFGNLPEDSKNRVLIQGITETFLKTTSTEQHKMVWSQENNAWVGKAYDNSENALNGECKYWIANDVIQKIFAVSLPLNDSANDPLMPDYQWNPGDTVSTITSAHEYASLTTALEAKNLVTAGDMIQYVSGTGIQHTVIVGSVTASGVWVFDSNYFDQSPSYHFLSFDSLTDVDLYSVYRIK